MKGVYDKIKANQWKCGGTYVFTKPVLMLVDTEMIKDVLTREFDHFAGRGFYYNEEVSQKEIVFLNPL